MQRDLTKGNLFKQLVQFAVPYLISCFLQTFYGMADLFITGQFNGAGPVSAVSVGSQLMHMLTVVIVGLAMGATVSISRAIGAKQGEAVSDLVGNSITLFAGVALCLTAILLLCTDGIMALLAVPPEATAQARDYLVICFLGIPFITAYNVISSIFRGMGDTNSPMRFVAVAGLINVGFDYLLIGPLGMGAAGAALATVGSQAFSVVYALISLKRRGSGIKLQRHNLKPQSAIMRQLISIGAPIACQDGLIQVSFLVITAIANSRGVTVAAAVGIVEKIISFLFLVPSAMLSTVSTVAAQNAGAGLHARGRSALYYGMGLSVGFGVLSFIVCQFAADGIVGMFVTNEPDVVLLGAQYLRAYALDCMFASVHFCFSGYFSAYERSGYSFLHNIISVAVIRIPGAYLASRFFPDTLYPMGLAAPMGSLLSVIICVLLYRRLTRSLPEAKGV